MSRLGKKPVPIAAGAKVSIAGKVVKFEGPKGKLELTVPDLVNVEVKGGEVLVTRKGEEKQDRAFHGLVRALINNNIIGVTQGYRRVLQLKGVGYKAELKGKNLSLAVGLSEPVIVPVPANLTVTVEPGTGEFANNIVVVGADKQAVGNFAAETRKVRKPEPYKGKGIRFEGEKVKIKAGKAFAGAGAK